MPALAGFLPSPSLAATIETETAQFGAAIIDLTCSFGSPMEGTLGVNADKTIIGTDQTGGFPTTYVVSTNFSNGTLIADTPTLLKTGGTPVANTAQTILDGVEQGTQTLNSGDTSVSVGAKFTSSSGAFDGGSYDTSITLTCTDDGNK